MEFNYESINKNLKEELENKDQIIYEFKRKLQTVEILQKEYQEEIERLNNDKIEIERKFLIKIEQFEEEKQEFRNNVNEGLQTLQKALSEKELEVVNLKAEIEFNNKTQSCSLPLETSNEEVEELKDTIVALQYTIESLKDKLNISQRQYSNLEEIHQFLKGENESLQQTINFKRDELKEAHELIQGLQDDNMCLKSELDSLNNKPLDVQSRGNSLFAEVNDSRVQLVKKLKNVATKYNEMAKDRANLVKEIDNLRSNTSRLTQLVETDMKDLKRFRNETEINAYESQVDGLRKLIVSYKEEIANIKKNEQTSASTDLAFYESRLNSKEKELKSVRTSLDHHSTDHILQARKLVEVETQMVNWKWKALNFENQVQILENKVKELESGCNIEIESDKQIKLSDLDAENETENSNKKGVSRVSKIAVKVENSKENPSNMNISTAKENCDVNLGEKFLDITNNQSVNDTEVKPQKSVQFKENTKEESDHTVVRRRGRVIVKPLPISHYTKKAEN